MAHKSDALDETKAHEQFDEVAAEAVSHDLTDWPRWSQLLSAHVVRWIDSIFVVVINGIALGCALLVGAVGYLLLGPISNAVFPYLTTTFKIPVTPSKPVSSVVASSLPSEKMNVHPNSITASSPLFFSAFAEKMRLDPVFADHAIHEGLCRVPNSVEKKSRPPFNVWMAKLFIHLAALSYESSEVIAHFSSLYGLEVETVAGDGTTVNIFYSVENNFIILAFCGSSPFDLSEFLAGAMIQKAKAEGDVLPGAVHEAYLNMLHFPDAKTEEKEVEGMVRIVSESAQARQQKTAIAPGLSVLAILKALDTQVFPKFENRGRKTHENGGSHESSAVVNGHSESATTVTTSSNKSEFKEPFIWFTGHSTGACLASLVLAHLVHAKSPLVTHHLIKGCYTFGSPKCGDSEFASAVAKACTANQIVLYRVVNANDIVPSFPLGSSQSSRSNESESNIKWKLRRASDYKHVGVPVILHYDTPGYTVGAGRDLECIVKNTMWFFAVRVPAAFGRVITGRATVVGVFQTGWPFPWEHLPVEYDKRLK
ncbi:hypothetical protein CcCBS67573_g04944 [Chytriomyces confervae]|uniref:Fungal lipase-type domain-containing protein n=1 Tax=Chytriomyces confervae TaxID=246404 RepID=A0A507FBS9_9FUNG|nr:hypothetical protein HDU80_009825 [Chytriomyces hyalinus]TPX73791.1 hypothetical protein CcCBS67573_g04944 [Chytriomyces confervae]